MIHSKFLESRDGLPISHSSLMGSGKGSAGWSPTEVEDGLNNGDLKNGVHLASSISMSPLAPSCHVPSVLVSLPVAVMKYHNKSNVREKRFILLTVPAYSSSLQGRQGIRDAKQPAGHIIFTVRSTAVNECIPMLSSSLLYSYTTQHLLPREWCHPQ